MTREAVATARSPATRTALDWRKKVGDAQKGSRVDEQVWEKKGSFGVHDWGVSIHLDLEGFLSWKYNVDESESRGLSAEPGLLASSSLEEAMKKNKRAIPLVFCKRRLSSSVKKK